MNLNNTIFSGKSSKSAYYAFRYLTLIVPNFIYRLRKAYLLWRFRKMSPEHQEMIMDRVNYYCKLSDSSFPEGHERIKTLGEHKLKNKKTRGYASVYFFDTYEYMRTLPKHLKWAYYFGDVWYHLPLPAFTKSRPISSHNENSVILKLNKLRHFISVNDKKSFEEKGKIALFRGDIRGKKSRVKFVEMFHNSTICDTGDVAMRGDFPQEWYKPKLSLYEHLEYKFIVTLEGNDVASNLKWVMSSNSVAVMPRPTCETWFMEGRLLPNVHYIEIAKDFSNLEERINYYLEHPQEAKAIAKNANDYWEKFRCKRDEDIISHLVVEKYFTQTLQQF